MSNQQTTGGLRTRHILLGIALPIQGVSLTALQGFGHALCGTGLFDNPITYTTALTALIGLIDYFKNSGKN
ncbi:MAG: hypothetical protein ACYDAJ_02680 [Nitrosotalea sp.]